MRFCRPASVCSSQPRWLCSSSCTDDARPQVHAARERPHERAHARRADVPFVDRLRPRPVVLEDPWLPARRRPGALGDPEVVHERAAARRDVLGAVVEGEVARAGACPSRPPRPRDRSNTVTLASERASSRAQASPAMPAPMTAMLTLSTPSPVQRARNLCSLASCVRKCAENHSASRAANAILVEHLAARLIVHHVAQIVEQALVVRLVLGDRVVVTRAHDLFLEREMRRDAGQDLAEESLDRARPNGRRRVRHAVR